jgi:hypothetical protein
MVESGYSRNFIDVRITDDGTTVRVNATSEKNGVPVTGDPATEIQVLLIGLPGCSPTLVSRPETIPVGASWEAAFPNAVAQLAHCPSICVVGIAHFEYDDPVVWGTTTTLRSRTQ